MTRGEAKQRQGLTLHGIAKATRGAAKHSRGVAKQGQAARSKGVAVWHRARQRHSEALHGQGKAWQDIAKAERGGARHSTAQQGRTRQSKMTTVEFTKQEFEKVLANSLRAVVDAMPATHHGQAVAARFSVESIKGEYQYYITLPPTNKRLVVRSSVKVNTDRSAASGDDSIRIYVQYWFAKAGKWFALARVDRLTKRTAGWDKRMATKLEQLYKLALEDSRCQFGATVTKSAPTRKAVAIEPVTDLHHWRESRSSWLCTRCHTKIHNCDASDLPVRGCNPNLRQPTKVNTFQINTTASKTPAPSLAGSNKAEGTINNGMDDQAGELLPASGGTGVVGSFEIAVAGIQVMVAEQEEDIAPVAAASKDTPTPNAQQLAAITAPIQAVRVPAGPGSGKTFVVARRVAHLLAQGIDPAGIYAVTFSKDMSSELLDRIIKVNPALRGTPVEQQACTIHALCYRILKKEGDRRQKAKDWMVAKNLKESITELWAGDKIPTWREVAAYIDAAKRAGLDANASHDFYRLRLTWLFSAREAKMHASSLAIARERLDRDLRARSLLTYADMLYDVDVRLRDDAEFRTRWRTKVVHLIVDEAQDTSAQAMRIIANLYAQPDDPYLH